MSLSYFQNEKKKQNNCNLFTIKYVKIYSILVYLIIKTLKCPSDLSKLCHYPIFKTKKKQNNRNFIIVRYANA